MCCRLFLLFLFLMATVGCSDPALLSIDGMRARDFTATLEFERTLEDGPSFTAYLVSYKSSGLKAMITCSRMKNRLLPLPATSFFFDH
jgi:hypothetical protein